MLALFQIGTGCKWELSPLSNTSAFCVTGAFLAIFWSQCPDIFWVHFEFQIFFQMLTRPASKCETLGKTDFVAVDRMCAMPCSQQGDIAARIFIHTNIRSPKFILIGMHFLHQNIFAQENLDAILSLLQNICTTKYLYNKEFFYGCQTYKRTLFSSWNRQYGMKTSIFQKFLCSVFYGFFSLPTLSCSVFSKFHDDSHSNSGWRKAASKLLRLPDPPSHSLFQHHLHRHQVHLHRHDPGHCQLNNCRCRHGEED